MTYGPEKEKRPDGHRQGGNEVGAPTRFFPGSPACLSPRLILDRPLFRYLLQPLFLCKVHNRLLFGVVYFVPHGRQAKIRGRIFRVGHSAKSNTYFLNFGPSKEALTAVIFASAAELFEKSELAPRNYENREVEITGTVKDHPQFGVEVILEDPKQIKVID